jgi:hypothetical protein
MKRRVSLYIFTFGLVILFGINTISYAKQTQATASELIDLDSDKDGYTNLCETLHKTNPNDANSKPSSNITINVPSDAGSIQEAINVAIDGDTIAVSDGTYKGNINFKGKSLTLTSDSANTIIEGTEQGSVVTIDSNSILKGFTITSKNIDARGIYVKDASPTIENCTIIDNKTAELGGGVFSTQNSSPEIINCIITGNTDASGNSQSAQVSGETVEVRQSYIEGPGLVDNTTESTPTPPPVETPTAEIIATEKIPYETPPRYIRPTTETLTSLSTNTITTMQSAALTINTDSLVNKLFAGGSNPASVYKYTGGTNWQRISAGSALESQFAVLSLVEYNGELYAGTRQIPSWFEGIGKVWKYEGEGTNWTLVGDNLDLQVSALVVYYGNLYAGTSSLNKTPYTGSLYRYDYEGGTLNPNSDWTKIVDTATGLGMPNPDTDWLGFRCLYVSDITGEDILHIGDIEGSPGNGYGDFFGHYTVTGNEPGFIVDAKFKDKAQSCVWDFAEYNNELYACAYKGLVYKSTNGFSWTAIRDTYQDYNSWEIEAFRDYLYITDGPQFSKSVDGINWNAVWTNSDGYDIISMIGTKNFMIFGTGCEAGYYDGASATIGKVYVYDETGDPQLISGNMSGGIQTLMYPEQLLWYVDDSQDNPPGDGKSWDTAFKYLQDALAVAAEGEEIRVAQGTYKPDQAETITIEPGDRTATFQLVNGVTIKGGYKGGDNLTGNKRSIRTYQTTLSGDIDNNDLAGFVNYDNNSYHVLTGSNTDATAVLDGFTITGGNANGSGVYYDGGGMYNYTGSPTVANCIFYANRTNGKGGGMYNSGIWNSGDQGSNPRVANCMFVNNEALYHGGGMYNYWDSDPILTNCVFSNNSATRFDGGAIANFANCNLTIINCTFSNNYAGRRGGAINNNMHGGGTVTNSIFWGNSAIQGGNQIFNSVAYPTVSFCDIEGGLNNSPGCGGAPSTDGGGNIPANPLFANPGNPLSDGLRLGDGSLCIDAANGDTAIAPLTDILGFTRIDIPGIPNATSIPADMGAYEKTFAVVWYVDNNAELGGDGRSWKTAFKYLQDALNNPLLATDDEIRVAEGTYKPDQDKTHINGTQDCKATFRLINGVTIKGGYRGGYKGGDNQACDERVIKTYQTILSGDIGTENNSSDNSNHVVTGSDTDATAVLDGFTIRDGYAHHYGYNYDPYDNPYPHILGGGMIILGGSPTIINCNFTNNVSSWGNGQGMGGAVFISSSSYPTFKNCVFYNNYSDSGGGILILNGSAEITNCVFANNDGGALSIVYSEGPQPKVTNCTFYGNDIGLGNMTSGSIITNCIFWGNGVEIDVHDMYDSHTPKPTVTYSNIRGGGWGGVGNIGENPVAHDPLFWNTSNPAGSDGIFGTLDDGLQLKKGSPCSISATNPDVAPDTDILGFTRDDISPDMGAYEQVTTYITAVVPGGQIYISTDYGDTWNAKDSNRNWSGVAVSFTGQYQTAVVSGGKIYVSENYGEDWSPEDSNRNWYDVAMSPDGKYQTAVVLGGQIYVSTDSGENWSPKESNRNWYQVAVSSTGEYQTAVVYGGQIYVSTNSGEDWSPKGNSSSWWGIAMSSDGSRLTAVLDGGAPIYVSDNRGDTWVAKDYLPWMCVAMSSDGSRQTVVPAYEPPYVSIDYGNTWAPKWGNDDNCWGYQWKDVAMSSDGSVQAATTYNTETVTCLIYVSTDYGITWTAKGTEEGYIRWGDIAVSH